MGDRANYIVIKETDEGRTADIYYYHWGAVSMPADLFWGFGTSLDFIEGLPPADELMDNLWCEGIALLDIPERRFILWCSEDLGNFPEYRKVWMAWARLAWSGWEVWWAYFGLDDVLRYLGWSEEPLQEINPAACAPVRLRRDLRRAHAQCVVTVRHDKSKQKTYYLRGISTSDALCAGPEHLPAYVRRHASLLTPELASHFEPDEWEYTWYYGTILVDVPRKHLSFWQRPDGRWTPSAGLYAAVERRWPGWTVQEHYEGMFGHCRAAGLDWRPYVMDEASVVSTLTEKLADPQLVNPAAITQGLAAAMPGVELNVSTPYFFHTDAPRITPGQRQAFLEQIIRAWRSQEGYYEATLAAQDVLYP